MSDSAAPASLLTEQVRTLVGRSVTVTAPEPLGHAAIRYFALAVGDDNPLYTDAAFARAHGHRDVIAPPTLLCETNQLATTERDEDGFAGFSWTVPVPPGTALVRGGNAYRFHRPARPDDVVTSTFTVLDATTRTSSGGDELLVLTTEIRYTAADGELIATNRETLIWRGAA